MSKLHALYTVTRIYSVYTRYICAAYSPQANLDFLTLMVSENIQMNGDQR